MSIPVWCNVPHEQLFDEDSIVQNLSLNHNMDRLNSRRYADMFGSSALSFCYTLIQPLLPSLIILRNTLTLKPKFHDNVEAVDHWGLPEWGSPGLGRIWMVWTIDRTCLWPGGFAQRLPGWLIGS